MKRLAKDSNWIAIEKDPNWITIAKAPIDWNANKKRTHISPSEIFGFF
jgi:hypothetical protein